MFNITLKGIKAVRFLTLFLEKYGETVPSWLQVVVPDWGNKHAAKQKH